MSLGTHSLGTHSYIHCCKGVHHHASSFSSSSSSSVCPFSGFFWSCHSSSSLNPHHFFVYILCMMWCWLIFTSSLSFLSWRTSFSHPQTHTPTLYPHHILLLLLLLLFWLWIVLILLMMISHTHTQTHTRLSVWTTDETTISNQLFRKTTLSLTPTLTSLPLAPALYFVKLLYFTSSLFLLFSFPLSLFFSLVYDFNFILFACHHPFPFSLPVLWSSLHPLFLLYLELIYYFIFNYHHHHHLIHQHGCNGFQVCLLANFVSTTQHNTTHTQILSLSHLIIHLSLFFVSLFGQCTHTHTYQFTLHPHILWKGNKHDKQ